MTVTANQPQERKYVQRSKSESLYNTGCSRQYDFVQWYNLAIFRLRLIEQFKNYDVSVLGYLMMRNGFHLPK